MSNEIKTQIQVHNQRTVVGCVDVYLSKEHLKKLKEFADNEREECFIIESERMGHLDTIEMLRIYKSKS